MTGVDGLYGRSATYESIVGAVDTVAAAAGADLGRHHPAVPAGDALGHLRADRLPRVVPRPHGLGPRVPGERKDHAELLRRTEATRTAGRCSRRPTSSCARRPAIRSTRPIGHAARGRPDLRDRRLLLPPRAQPRPVPHAVVPDARVRLRGRPRGARAHRDDWLGRGLDLLTDLGPRRESVVANDPFFGRPGRMLAADQRAEELKFELVTPVLADRRRRPSRRPTATSTTSASPSTSRPPTASWPTAPASHSASTASR